MCREAGKIIFLQNYASYYRIPSQKEATNMEEQRPATDPKAMLGSIVEIFQAVVRAPASFFRQMPISGGYADPLIFAVVMGVAAGIVRIVLSLLGFSFAGFFMLALGSIIVVPIITVLITFVAAAILFAIWQLMGSRQSYEVSFRCAAYALAISPITAALNFIPYLGIVVSLAWMAYILVCASVEVHGTDTKSAWIVFGAICAVLALGSVTMQYSARSFQHRMEMIGKGLGDIDKMKPEEAGKAVGEFLKGMQKGMDKK
jgi:hypothetical protein